MKYRIEWKSKITGKSGFGTGLFPSEQAKDIVKGPNNKKDGLLAWRIVPVKRPNLFKFKDEG